MKRGATESPVLTFRPLEPLLCVGSLAGHEFQGMNQMVKGMWICVLGWLEAQDLREPRGDRPQGGAEKP